MKKFAGALLSSLFISHNVIAELATAPVYGFARDFVSAKPISDAKVTILETGEQVKLDNNGHFGPIQWTVGKPITFVVEKIGYRTTQTATIIVPPAGLVAPYSDVSLEPVDVFMFYLLATTMTKILDETKCHVATTITAYHKTLADLPQGERDAKVLITPNVAEVPYYFDIFTSGPLKDYPNPATHGLTQTSDDGGVIYTNLESRDEPYVITASKPGISFTQTQVICRKGVFVNASPPQGPTVI